MGYAAEDNSAACFYIHRFMQKSDTGVNINLLQDICSYLLTYSKRISKMKIEV